MAAADYFDQVQKLYIAYFGRPADPAGLNYWAANIDAAGGNFSAAIAGFAASAESQALYAAGTTAQLVTSVYIALFNRPPEAAGLAYWVSQIDAGTISGAGAAYQILTSAGPGDAAAIANKVTAANAFTANIDTSAELAGYSGASSAAIARAWLAKTDATPFSLANLLNGTTQGVAEATGTQSTPTAPAGPAFTATKDNAGVVTFTNASMGVSVTEAAGVFTFTSNGTGGIAGTATVTGPITGIVLTPMNATLTIAASLADTITLPNANIRLSDTIALDSVLLQSIEQRASLLVNATSVTGITGATAARALDLLVTKSGNSGDKIWFASNVPVTLTSTTADGTTLASIDGATTGLVNGSSITSITNATVAQATQLLVTGDGTAFTHNAGVTVALTDTSANAAALQAIDGKTTGLVTAGSLTTLTGNLADTQTVLEAITANTALSAANLTTVTLQNAITAASLNNVVFANNTTINLANVAGNSLTLQDSSVTSGKTLTISGLGVTSAISIDARNESDAHLTLVGGSGNDQITVGKAGNTVTGGGGSDVFNIVVTGGVSSSTATALTTITDYRTSGLDTIEINGLVAVASNLNSVQDFTSSGFSTLTEVLNQLAADNIQNNGLTVTIFGNDTYIYVESDGAGTSYAAGDTVIKLTGKPFAANIGIDGLGIDSV
ncbi:DUF4214 domain-containing protein [Pseudomonas sp. 21LCFQ010]|uniref:DUF4214 domain-containing protein n=1 Tax=Pseudomonas sp. 21LCFQ010 TaxID=2957506 RepID=UPI0020981BB3|nr:DUF4214 domain-containing protein [Pseudomonas sp. 21LCFQ010]MCO8164193.1 DUF4214 domain-containing protein [Pseudomonas sp. 21LCFQ010]